LGFELQRAEFKIPPSEISATISIDDNEQKEWQFEIHTIPDFDHAISVAYGPGSCVVESCKHIYKWTLTGDEVPNLNRMAFTILSFDEIINEFLEH